jgi:serine/threonine protein kinase
MLFHKPRNVHVVQVYDFWYYTNVDEEYSRTFVKMERCHGNLEEYIAELNAERVVIEPLELVEIMIHILSGLWHCHQLEVCHCGLKLSNSNHSFLCYIFGMQFCT